MNATGPARSLLPRILLGAAFAAYAARAISQLSLASRGITGFIDDAFYYIVIARHFAVDGSITFDGVNPTNGFHPLWMLLVAGVYRALGTGAPLVTQLVGVKALELAMLGAALLACAYAYRRTRGSSPIAWGFVGYAVVLLVPGWPFFAEGMETTLAAAIMPWVLLAMAQRNAALLAGALPLLFLARLDTLVFVVAPLAAAWLAVAGRRAWVALLPVAIVAAAYLSLNEALTGSFTPISGQIKSSFPHLTPHWSFLRDPLDALPWTGWKSVVLLPSLLQVSVALALVAACAPLLRRSPGFRLVVLALAITLLLILNQLLFQRWDKGVDSRYLALPWLLVAFAGFTMLGAWRRDLAAFVAIVAMGTGAAASVLDWRARAGERMDRTTHFEVMRLTSPGERFAGTDIGAFSFWLERPFVNLDGLVNNRRLQEAIRDRRLGEYLREMDVRYLALAFWDAPQAHVSRSTDHMYRSRIFPAAVGGANYDHYDFTVYSYLFGVDSDPVRLCPAQEIFRTEIGRDGTANASIVIYKLARPCGG